MSEPPASFVNAKRIIINGHHCFATDLIIWNKQKLRKSKQNDLNSWLSKVSHVHVHRNTCTLIKHDAFP